jgi:hypothetical protein
MIPDPTNGESQQHTYGADLRPLTQNERFWLEVIRLSSWDSDPAPTLELVQQLRLIFEPANRGSAR